MWVREAWVGLELPLASRRELTCATVGILTGPRSYMGQIWARVTGRTERVTGYLVQSAPAIALLSTADPQAAAWWRESAPRFCQGGSCFVFDSSACEPLVAD